MDQKKDKVARVLAAVVDEIDGDNDEGLYLCSSKVSQQHNQTVRCVYDGSTFGCKYITNSYYNHIKCLPVKPYIPSMMMPQETSLLGQCALLESSPNLPILLACQRLLRRVFGRRLRKQARPKIGLVLVAHPSLMIVQSVLLYEIA